MLAGILLAVSATMVPPGEIVVDHSQPYHWTQPTLRRYESWPQDMSRRQAYEAYCRQLDCLWREYRAQNSTPIAWRQYNNAASLAKRDYVYQDPWLAPIHNPERDYYYWNYHAPANYWKTDQMERLKWQSDH